MLMVRLFSPNIVEKKVYIRAYKTVLKNILNEINYHSSIIYQLQFVNKFEYI